MKDKTAEFFNSYSEKFDAIYGNRNNAFRKLINNLFRQTMVERFQKTLATCQPVAGKTVLDVGCGPGHYGIALAKKGVKDVLGIDFAPKMIDIAKQHAKLNGVDNICRFEIADFFELKNDMMYDYIVIMGFMDYVKNPLSMIKKAAALSKDKVVFSFPCDNGFLAWQRKFRYRFKCPLYLYNEKQLKDLFAQLKGWNVNIEKLSRDYFVVMEKDSL